MAVERSGFLFAAVALAAGGLGGWVAHESKVGTGQTAVAPPVMAATPPAPSPPTVLVVEHVTPPPACDDSTGSVEDCPVVGPSDEGVCNLAAKRCAEFKLAFKPKVAQTAVACLRRLKGNELCDPARVNGCGHSALMAACPDPVPPLGATDKAGAPTPSLVAASCEGIVKGCSSEPLSPTMSDCRQTLAGMSDTGRSNMMACVSAPRPRTPWLRSQERLANLSQARRTEAPRRSLNATGSVYATWCVVPQSIANFLRPSIALL